MKQAIRLRADADRKARAYARLLAGALSDAATAAEMMNQINQVYNMNMSTQTLLVHSLTEQMGVQLLTDVLGESLAGEEAVLFNQVADGNGGQPLPADVAFGERVAVVRGGPVVSVAKSSTAESISSEICSETDRHLMKH